MATSIANIQGSRPRIIGANARKHIGKDVIVVGEAISLNMTAKTVTLRLPDNETIIVLLQNNSSTIENHLLTEVHGRLVSQGNIEATAVIQHSSENTRLFNTKLYCEMSHLMDAFPNYYEA